jgi:hypothetical protein
MYGGMARAGWHLFFVGMVCVSVATASKQFQKGTDCHHWYTCAYHRPANRDRILKHIASATSCDSLEYQYALAIRDAERTPPHHCADDRLAEVLAEQSLTCTAPPGILPACNHTPLFTRHDTLFYGIFGGLALFLNATLMFMHHKEISGLLI